MVQGLVEINQQIHYLAIFALGIFALFVLTTTVAAIIWNVIYRFFRNGRGNTRKTEDREWTTTMVSTLTRIDTNIDNVCATLSSNGLAKASDIEELKRVVREECK